MGGIFGTVSRNDGVRDLFYGTDYHFHLGTKRGGMAVWDGRQFVRTIHSIESDYFRSKFEPDLVKFSGHLGIGVISDNDSQPLVIGSHLGSFALVTVARITNMDELTAQAYARCNSFSESTSGAINPTELVATLICQADSFEDGIRQAQAQIKGSCSMLLLTREGVYAARDRRGRTPLIIGRKAEGFAVASESCAFPNLGFEVHQEIGPGEIVFMTPEGIEQRRPPLEDMQICSFLWVYYGYPASTYEGINVETVRYRCGCALAANDDITPDYVAGIPDSGIGHALGYAHCKQIPYKRPYVKYTPTWPRSFMPQNQAMRDLVANMKLIPLKSLIAGQRVLFCDDSIVRGTQLKDNVEDLFAGGAAEVHMRIACPTLIHPCDFLNFSTSRSTLDLAGRRAITDLEGVEEPAADVMQEYATAGTARHRAMIENIRRRLHLTTLKYQTMDDLVQAIGLPKDQLCTHCWDGSSYF
ncbi:MAG: amidophosphoribosyltransferase [Desulfobacterales bacterium]|nr:amidophosphoribosyltransferase [Desulfobacterales bacterium]